MKSDLKSFNCYVVEFSDEQFVCNSIFICKFFSCLSKMFSWIGVGFTNKSKSWNFYWILQIFQSFSELCVGFNPNNSFLNDVMCSRVRLKMFLRPIYLDFNVVHWRNLIRWLNSIKSFSTSSSHHKNFSTLLNSKTLNFYLITLKKSIKEEKVSRIKLHFLSVI